jgi:trehalose 6-phosphate phosphatase
MKQEKLWLFDFDGALAAVHNHHAARLDPDCRDMLIMLIEKFPGRVAVVSSRPLNDLSSRIPVPGLFLGGTSGLAWLLPGGGKRYFHSSFAKPLYTARAALLPKIKELELNCGVDTEDKLWAFTLHVPHLSRQIQKYIFNTAQNWRSVCACEVFQGPESVKIHLLPENTKDAVIPHLCALLGLDPDAVRMTYAGGDENDIPLMRRILRHRGYVYTIGDTPLVSGGRIVKNPSLLAHEIFRLCECTGSAAADIGEQRSCHGTI